jgi:hypothetical protein
LQVFFYEPLPSITDEHPLDRAYPTQRGDQAHHAIANDPSDEGTNRNGGIVENDGYLIPPIMSMNEKIGGDVLRGDTLLSF